ncbi:hypothetical protein DV704_05265 [Meiothermus sp. QL-1]|uniref:hypothetical protein n=1 Tax=Meiothermus sp. QL-1 TaxID=2058095 RepID=UPI000E09EB04|nr:hypothetical protein [Meiothermus sp. QL-1]RDI95687.1 hypothetical protein DV704_05265 [Meiothermus sp. QL-1]
MLERLTEQFLEDEALTEGLSDEEAGELLGWLIGVVEDLEASEEASERLVAQMRRLGREMARIARRYRVPVEELIELVELAWEGEDPAAHPMQA